MWRGGREGELCVLLSVCLREGRDTVHSSGIRGLMKKIYRNVWLQSDGDGETRGHLTSPAGSTDLPQPNLQF